MPWIYSNGSGTPPSYRWWGVNTYNQSASPLTFPSNCAVTQLKVYASGYYASVSTRLALWNAGGSVKVQSSTFTMASGTASVGGQAWQTRSVTSTYLASGTYWVGLYRNPATGHIIGSTSSGTTGYKKTNTSTFPSISTMSGYTSDDKRMYVGAFYITAPNTPTSCSVSRNSDTSQTISWNRTADSDQPIDGFKVYRYDNITGSYYYKATVTGPWTTNGSNSYTDTTTTGNRYYKYKVYAYNDAGNSSYSNEDDINTTPTAPSYVTATRVSGNVEITWHDNAANEGYYKVQRNTSSDGVSWAGYSTLTSTLAANSTSYTDTSPANYNYYKISATCTNPSLESTQVESNEVIILQPPDAPTGLSPDGGYVFSAANGKLFSWTHNPNDGSEQTKYSLRVKKSTGNYPKIIEAFTDSSDWSEDGTTVSDDSVNNLYGNSAVTFHDDDDSAGYSAIYRSISAIDLTEFEDASASDTSDLIVFLFYVDDTTKHYNIGFKLGTDNSNNYYYFETTPFSTIVNGWNRFAIPKSSFSSTGSVNWNNITYVRIESYTNANASNADIICQCMYMVDDSPTFADYAGDYFAYYSAIASTDEDHAAPADSFINGNDYTWQVKTWGDATTGGTFSDGSSDWSDEATFTATSYPVATITTPNGVDNYDLSELTLEWTYTQAEGNNQTQYLAELYDENFTLLESKSVSSVIASGASDSCTFDYILSNNTTYNVVVTVKESNGLWNDSGYVEFLTEFLQPTKPSLSLEFNDDSATMDVTITNPDVVTGYTLESSQDTYIDNDNSSTNYNDNGQLQLEDDTAGGTTIKTILLDFDLTEIIGKTINSATLVLARKTTLTPGIDSAVNYIKSSFDETTVTYGTIPTLDTTDYDDHTHTSGDNEEWDITSLISDIADEVITDYEGLAIVATTTDGSTDEFYDSTITDSEPTLIIEIEPENAETDHNVLYRSIDGGDFELVLDNIPKNTTVTDYIPSIGGNNNYYVEAVSASPSSNYSDEVDEDVLLTGYYYINAGDGFESYVGFIGDNSINEAYNKDVVLNRYEGRTYPVKNEGSQIDESINFSSEILNTLRESVKILISATGEKIYRDFEGRWFSCEITDNKFTKKTNTSYQFNCVITRLEDE